MPITSFGKLVRKARALHHLNAAKLELNLRTLERLSDGKEGTLKP